MVAAIPVDAATQAGIVDELVQAGDALGQALKVARDYIQIPPKAYATIKYQNRQHVIEALKAEIAKRWGVWTCALVHSRNCKRDG